MDFVEGSSPPGIRSTMRCVRNRPNKFEHPIAQATRGAVRAWEHSSPDTFASAMRTRRALTSTLTTSSYEALPTLVPELADAIAR
jgi:hypothetical protein